MLRRRVAELEAVFEAFGDGLLVVDTAGQVVEANGAAVALLDLGRKERALGPLAPILQGCATRGDGRPLRPADLVAYRTLRDGQIARGDLLIGRATVARIVETVASPIRDGDGAVLGVVLVLRDITARRRRERERAVLDAAGDLLATSPDVPAALEGLTSRWTAELVDWCAFYVYQATVLRPVAVRHRSPEAARLAGGAEHRPVALGDGFVGAAAAHRRTLAVLDLTDELVRRYSKRGCEVPTVHELRLRSVIAVPIFGPGGLAGALSIGSMRTGRPLDTQDVRFAEEVARRVAPRLELARGQAALAESLRRSEAVLDSLPHGLALFDQDGRIVLVNAELGRMLDLDGDLVGVSIEDLVGRVSTRLEDPMGAEAIVRQPGMEGLDPARAELRLVGPPTRDVEWVSTVLRDPVGEIQGRLAVCHDVTHIRGVQRVKDESASSMGRELSGPVTAISSYAAQALRTTRDVPGDRSIAHGLEVILRNARQLTVLVAELLDADRADIGNFELALTELDVLRLVGRAVDEARGLTTMHRLRLEAPASLPPARWDAARVRQALLNVLSNAMKYWPAGGQIGIRVRVHEDGALISVRDRGLGIPPTELERVFERFYRVDAPDHRRIRGHGLGLHLVRGVATAHGGAAWAQSTGVPGQGTTVHLLLPWRVAADDARP